MYSVQEIAAALGADVFGDDTVAIGGVSEPASAGPTDLALAMDPRYADGLSEGLARAAILWAGADWVSLGLDAAIVVRRARYAMSGLTAFFDNGPEIEPGVHALAYIHPAADISEDVSIGPFAVVGPRARIGAGARIAAHVTVAEDSKIGDGALLHSGVHIGARVVIGDRFIAHSGAVVGADGFSFVTPEKSRVESARESLGADVEPINTSWTRIHSLGAVQIGNDVEVGANSTIDRGTIRDTVIGHRTKIDNLVHIGHNVQVGQDVLLCGQVGIAGSSKIGDRVVLGGQCGVSDNITVGDDVVAGGATKIFSRVPAGRAILGSPAIKMEAEIEQRKFLRRLPRLFAEVAKLKKAVPNLGDDD